MTSDQRPATATTCLKCFKEPVEFDAEGYSLCCRVHWELDENQDFIYKPPADPAAKRSKSSRYRGVTRVQRATVGKRGFRVQISRNGINYYPGIRVAFSRPGLHLTGKAHGSSRGADKNRPINE